MWISTELADRFAKATAALKPAEKSYVAAQKTKADAQKIHDRTAVLLDAATVTKVAIQARLDRALLDERTALVADDAGQVKIAREQVRQVKLEAEEANRAVDSLTAAHATDQAVLTAATELEEKAHLDVLVARRIATEINMHVVADRLRPKYLELMAPFIEAKGEAARAYNELFSLYGSRYRDSEHYPSPEKFLTEAPAQPKPAESRMSVIAWQNFRDRRRTDLENGMIVAGTKLEIPVSEFDSAIHATPEEFERISKECAAKAEAQAEAARTARSRVNFTLF